MSGMPAFGITKGDGSAYVPDMTHHHHVDINGEVTVQFVDTVADGANLFPLTELLAGATLEIGIEIKEPYGRTLAFVTEDTDGVFTVYGRDYLGQYMTQEVTATAGAGATTKAFKFVDRIISSSNAGDVTMNAGSGYGLPFCAVELVREVVDGVASTEGTVTAAVSTTPSATTGDTRGTYNPNTAGNAAKDISVTYIATPDLPGGLYGRRQA